jgi:hypothetical protein
MEEIIKQIEVKSTSDKLEILSELLQLINKYPNDMELGEKIRQYVYNDIK